MHPYIPHLIADIKAAHRKENLEKENNSQSLEEHFEEIEAWVRGDEAEHTFGYHCGLLSENFPPPEKLTQKEMKLIRKEFERMMYTWNVDIDLPKKLPVDFAYKMIVDTLDSNIMIVNSGGTGFDYCSGNPPECIFKEYCPCWEYWNNPVHFTDAELEQFRIEMESNSKNFKTKVDDDEPGEFDIPW